MGDLVGTDTGNEMVALNCLLYINHEVVASLLGYWGQHAVASNNKKAVVSSDWSLEDGMFLHHITLQCEKNNSTVLYPNSLSCSCGCLDIFRSEFVRTEEFFLLKGLGFVIQ